MMAKPREHRDGRLVEVDRNLPTVYKGRAEVQDGITSASKGTAVKLFF